MPSSLAVFACRPNSHPFQERHVYLDEPVKIGRSVARCRPAQNNATFDCKVLSRNHALVWFDHKTGKYFHKWPPQSDSQSPVVSSAVRNTHVLFLHNNLQRDLLPSMDSAQA
ncbi:hypothetical protein PFLUV_G00038200 [Perca fluviatilis]|uniref:FHA domain-containing protein n=1 Tax=Perca fluviatilis TaxID=8168 RepID=A0A6A5FKC7_PERFL|nr:hypothetical protein PFLUV_G00038200 [Perca fluviatilis]